MEYLTPPLIFSFCIVSPSPETFGNLIVSISPTTREETTYPGKIKKRRHIRARTRKDDISGQRRRKDDIPGAEKNKNNELRQI